jgi:sialate O-acetylesterase
MDFALPMAFNATAEGEAANEYPDIRLYTVQKCEGGSPHHCEYTRGQPALEFLNASFIGQQWVRASKDSVYGSTPWTAADYGAWEAKIAQTVGGKGFSAACWFFGRELYKRRKYPIGLVWSSIGGSPDEWWMPPAAFEACGSQPRIGDGWAAMISPLLRNVIKGVVSERCLLLLLPLPPPSPPSLSSLTHPPHPPTTSLHPHTTPTTSPHLSPPPHPTPPPPPLFLLHVSTL